MKIFLNIILILAFLGLCILGIGVIIQSNNAYEKSVILYGNYFDSVTMKRSATAQTQPAQPCFSCIRDGYSQSILFFSLALGALLLILFLPRIQTISFGGIILSLKDIKDQVDVIKQQNNISQSSSVDVGGGKTLSADKATELKKSITKKIFDNSVKYSSDKDPQKNQWGGKTENADRKISAVVTKSKYPDLFNVVITVESKDPVKSPLKGMVTFHLHNTFRNSKPIIAVQDGKAILNLQKVWGAFTVGAEIDEGDEKPIQRLEFDLDADLPDGDPLFKSR